MRSALFKPTQPNLIRTNSDNPNSIRAHQIKGCIGLDWFRLMVGLDRTGVKASYVGFSLANPTQPIHSQGPFLSSDGWHDKYVYAAPISPYFRPPFQCAREMGGEAAQIPTSFGHELRACLRCRLVKTYDQVSPSSSSSSSLFSSSAFTLISRVTTSSWFP